MFAFLKRHLFALMLCLSLGLHAGAAWLGRGRDELPRLLPVQSGRSSVSLRSSVSAGPRPGQGALPEVVPAQPSPPKITNAGKEGPAPTALRKPSEADTSRLTPIASPTTPARPEKPSLPAPAIKENVQALKQSSKESAKTPTIQPVAVSKQDSKQENKIVTAGPKLPAPTKIADQVARSSRGSAGSVGAEVDRFPGEMPTNPAPPYPSEALAAGVEGKVVLWLKIDAEGRVTDVHIHKTSQVEALDQAALTTVRRWLFIPARRQGVPVPFEVLKTIEFAINR